MNKKKGCKEDPLIFSHYQCITSLVEMVGNEVISSHAEIVHLPLRVVVFLAQLSDIEKVDVVVNENGSNQWILHEDIHPARTQVHPCLPPCRVSTHMT